MLASVYTGVYTSNGVRMDAQKAALNWLKHRLDFAITAKAMESAAISEVDTREDYDEERYTTTCFDGNNELVVVCTMRDNICRLISARRARRNEREAYWQRKARRS